MKRVKVPARVLSSAPFRWAAPKVLPPTHKLLHRLSGGRLMFDSQRQPMCMLHTIGARSGEPRLKSPKTKARPGEKRSAKRSKKR